MAYDTARGVTVLFGGNGTGETWIWDGRTWQERRVTGPGVRDVHAMAYDAKRQRVVLFGGAGPGGPGLFDSFADTWEWDGARWARVS